VSSYAVICLLCTLKIRWDFDRSFYDVQRVYRVRSYIYTALCVLTPLLSFNSFTNKYNYRIQFITPCMHVHVVNSLHSSRTDQTDERSNVLRVSVYDTRISSPNYAPKILRENPKTTHHETTQRWYRFRPNTFIIIYTQSICYVPKRSSTSNGRSAFNTHSIILLLYHLTIFLRQNVGGKIDIYPDNFSFERSLSCLK